MDPREEFASANLVSRSRIKETEAVVADILYFAGLAEKGQAIPFSKLAEWMKTTHDFSLGRQRAERILNDHGKLAWWK